MTPHAYLTDRRIEKAKFWISEGRLPLAETAHPCGFSSQAYFTKWFKRQAGWLLVLELRGPDANKSFSGNSALTRPLEPVRQIKGVKQHCPCEFEQILGLLVCHTFGIGVHAFVS